MKGAYPVTSLPSFCSLPSLATDHKPTQIEESLIPPFGHLGLFFREGISLLRNWNPFLIWKCTELVGGKSLFAKKVLQRKHQMRCFHPAGSFMKTAALERAGGAGPRGKCL